MIVLYLWLSYRFPHVFKARPLANHAKALVEDAIEKTLREFSYTEKARLQLRKMRQQAMEELEMPKHTEQPAASANMDLGSETKVPQEVVDVLQDSSSFESSDAVIDDMDEYPTPEIDTETNGEELETGSAGDGGHRMSRAA
jgi:ATP-dependent RNA helicase SUPV3L1/SUV3